MPGPLGPHVQGLRRIEHVRPLVEAEHDPRQVELGQQRLSLTQQQREVVGLVAELGSETAVVVLVGGCWVAPLAFGGLT